MKFTAALVLAPLVAAMPSRTRQIYNPAHGVNGTGATAPDPSTYENVDISGFSLRETLDGSTVESVQFTINKNVTCSADSPFEAPKVFGCGSTPYSFGLLNGTDASEFGLAIYKQLAPFAGWYGAGEVDVACRSGGGDILICEQTGYDTIVII